MYEVIFKDEDFAWIVLTKLLESLKIDIKTIDWFEDYILLKKDLEVQNNIYNYILNKNINNRTLSKINIKLNTVGINISEDVIVDKYTIAIENSIKSLAT